MNTVEDQREATSSGRYGEAVRETTETAIKASLRLEGDGKASIETGIGFFDHMLEQTARHALFDIGLSAKGDLHIDAHHTLEDCGYTLGQALARALGERKGIARYGAALLPMDESLARVAVDLSGRPHLRFELPFRVERIGSCEVVLFREFFAAFAFAAGAAFHLESLYGENDHHRIEGVFKGLGRALREAVAIDERLKGSVPSTKGTLGTEGITTS